MAAEAEAFSADTRACDRCGNLFELPEKGAGRTRKMCHNCSPPIIKGSSSARLLQGTLPAHTFAPPTHDIPRYSSDLDPPATPVRVPSDLEESVIRELTDLDVMDIPDAKLAIRMCRALDDPDLTGTQIASLVKTLSSHLKALREAAPFIDEDEEAAKAALVLKLSRRL